MHDITRKRICALLEKTAGMQNLLPRPRALHAWSEVDWCWYSNLTVDYSVHHDRSGLKRRSVRFRVSVRVNPSNPNPKKLLQ